MFTLDSLPPAGTLRIYATADEITEESAAHGDAAASGWVDDIGSRVIYDARNDVRPVLELALPLDVDDVERVRDVVERLAPDSDSDGSTLYGVDADVDYVTGDCYRYALHAHVKYYGAGGWREDPVDILS